MTKFALLALTGGLLLAPTIARAQYDDDVHPLAPPVSGRLGYDDGDTFDWRDLPRNERVRIVRASFDQGGYQLFDNRGQCIQVPFESRNLYVMRFGRTSGSMYFAVEGGAPTLYLNESDYLENLAASGARWYPLPQRQYVPRPIYVGLAPTWNDYCTMGWYPGMTFFGGWWNNDPWFNGCRFAPMSSLTIRVGNASWTTWDDYCGYWRSTPARRVIFLDRPSYYSPTVIYRDRSDYRDYRRDDRFSRSDDRYSRGGSYEVPRGSSSRDREAGRVGGFDRSSNNSGRFDDRFSRSDDRFGSSGRFDSRTDDRFSRSDRGSRPSGGTLDRGSRPGGSLDRPTAERRPTSTRAPESSRGGRSGGSSRERESRRQ